MKLITCAMAGLVLAVAAHAEASAQTAPSNRSAVTPPGLALVPAERAKSGAAQSAGPTDPMPVHVPTSIPFMPVAVPDTTGLTMPVVPGGRFGSYVRFLYRAGGKPMGIGGDSIQVFPLAPGAPPTPRKR